MAVRFRTNIIAALVAACLALVVSAGNGAVPTSSADHPLRISFMQNPQTIYMRPGDVGVTLFADDHTSDPANLAPGQDEYCNGRWLTLPASAFDETPPSAGNLQTGNASWVRIDAWMRSMTFEGSLATWVVNDQFLAISRQNPILVETLTSKTMAQIRMGYNAPAILLDTREHPDEVRHVVAFLRDSGFPGMLGAHLRLSNPSLAQVAPWDFVVCDEEVIPVHYRGQAAASWVRQQAGQVPVMISPGRYDFLRDITWLSCGVAGLWYRPLPPPGTPPNDVAAIHLRAASAFLNRFEGGAVPLAPRWDGTLFHFCLEDFGRNWAGVIRGGTAGATIPAPAGLAGRLVGQSWYNPATDQSIIHPLTPLPGSVSVQPPDENLWIYSISTALPGSEDATTITAITDWAD